MIVKPHMTQHELVDAEPMVSTSATVARKEAMDKRREVTVRRAAKRLLREHDREAWVDEVMLTDDVDWERLWELVHDHAVGGRLEKTFRTLQGRYERANPSLVRIRFDPESEFDCEPGEYITVHYQHVPRAYSVASSPNRDHMEICVRRVPGGRLSTQLCDRLSSGDEIGVRGPFSGEFVGGEFLLQERSERDVAFLATGTGVAPFKSMIDYAFEEGFDEYAGGKRNIWLFLGASWEDDLPYHREFRTLADERENFHYVPTLSRETTLSEWDGETAYTQYTFATYLDREKTAVAELPDDVRPFIDEEPKYDIDARIDPNNLELYACGINLMVYGIVSVAEAVGVPAKLIRGEGYG
ncbi:FAD-binding oxidoreductase [Haladaptatus salinisoli]|uniref:FAD-binding oxidoreductase n=1 Tax=Haladaptatus salinisoli TaxID=2884876 RepID=UPI001D0AC871|nr:FAD-binding oxidoreductase [Haladaptatus salinisoli]